MKKQLQLTLAILTFALYSQASIIYVNPQATGSNDGTSWTNAKIDLQDAFNNVSSGDEVWIIEGVFQPIYDTSGIVAPNPRNATFYCTQPNVSIYGSFEGSETSIAQRDLSAHQTIFDGEIGTANSNDNHIVLLYLEDENIIIDGIEFNSIHFESIYPYHRGALYNAAFGMTVSNCSFSNNFGDRGAAIACIWPNLIIDNCVFNNNVSFDQGGAVYIDNLHSEISRCTFTNNRSAYGGALKLGSSASVTPHVVDNCIFSNNQSAHGSAIQMYNGYVEIMNCTFYNNGENASDAIFSIYNGWSMNINNSIIWNQSLTNPIAEVDNGSDVFSFKNCIVHNNSVSGPTIQQTNPMFADTINFKLSPCSPAIDLGVDSLYTVTSLVDVNGNNRMLNTIDIGATEFDESVYNIATNNNGIFSTNQTAPTYQWYDCILGTIVSGANAQQFSPTMNGTYSVITTTVDNCADTSNCLVITNLGVVESMIQSIKLFPNPSTTTLNIIGGSGKLTIVNLAGKIVFKSEVALEQINVSTLQSGVYLLHIHTEKGIVSKRFIKK